MAIENTMARLHRLVVESNNALLGLEARDGSMTAANQVLDHISKTAFRPHEQRYAIDAYLAAVEQTMNRFSNLMRVHNPLDTRKVLP